MSLHSQTAVFFGRYVWCLEVGLDVCRISRVLKWKSRGVVEQAFEGTLEECRGFQCRNGGELEGVILVDNQTNAKIFVEETEVDLPGYKGSFFETVIPADGSYRLNASRQAVGDIAEKVAQAGFRILKHVPAMFYIAASIDSENDGSTLFYGAGNGQVDFYFIQNNSFTAYYRVVNDNLEQAISQATAYVKDNYLVGALSVQKLERTVLANAAAEDFWLFRTDKMPAYHTATSQEALSNLKQSALFRRTFKGSLLILLISVLMVAFFRCGVMYYGHSNEGKIQEYAEKLEKRKQLAEFEAKLEKDRSETEVFLAHRSRYSTTMSDVAKSIPADLWITKWNINNRAHVIQGLASTSDDVSAMLQTLERTPGLFNARLRSTEKTTFKRNPVVRFEIQVEDDR